jgi:hypothetical protein
VANAALVTPSDANGWISFYNGGSADTEAILDVFGYFQSVRSAIF